MKIGTVILVLLSLGAVGLANGRESNPPTAQEIIDQIQQHVGVTWQGETVDTFKAGDPNTPVTGVAVTMMSTYDVLKRAAAEHLNLIITHEPTFYSHQDQTAEFAGAGDPVWREKQAFIREHHLVIWRFHDLWHRRQPDGILTGMVRALGWEKYQHAENPLLFAVPPTTLRGLAREIQDKIGMKIERVVGNPDLPVTRVGLVPGASGEAKHLALLRRNDVEALVIGEVPEWETIEYVADAAAQGRPKGLILMGHIPSEQAGMQYCAEWLKTFVTGVPVKFVATAEPFWTPR